MKQHFIPPDATLDELEKRAAHAEQRAATEPEPRATELREESEAISRMGRILAVWAVDLVHGF